MAGVDIPNDFPNSMMAGAVRRGQSRMVSADIPATIQTGEQNNTSIATASVLTVPPANAGNGFRKTTYAVITAVGGPAFITYDGSVPSSTNYAVTLSAGQSIPVQGQQALNALRIQGTSMSVSYWA